VPLKTAVTTPYRIAFYQPIGARRRCMPLVYFWRRLGELMADMVDGGGQAISDA